MCRSWMWWCIALALVASASADTWKAIKDEPYRELISHRHGLQGLPAIEGWGALGFAEVTALQPWGAERALATGYTNTSSKLQPFLLQVNNGRLSDFAVPLYLPEGAQALPGSSLSDLLIVDPAKGVLLYHCTASLTGCAQAHAESGIIGTVNKALQLQDGSGWLLASSTGLWYFKNVSGTSSLSQLGVDPADAVAECGEWLFYGNDERVVQLDRAGKVRRWEWVTQLTLEEGGVYGGPVRDMSCDKDGILFVANEISLNERALNGMVNRYDFQQGMPLNNATLTTVEPGTGAVWIGTPQGLLRYSRGQDDPDWRYFHGDRFLPHTSNVTHLVSLNSTHTLVATTGGISLLVWEQWTLRQKATHFLNILQARHNRHGLVGECDMAGYGQLSTCQGGPEDNSGLWTSLLVSAYAQAQALEPSVAHATALEQFQAGMELLVNVTNVQGLMARTCLAPNVSAPDEPNWYASKAPGLSGWHFKGDASSDEVVGHMFAHMMVYAMGTDQATRDRSQTYLLDIINHIVDNNFFLVDVTGLPTRWGIWNPQYINHNRSWSDVRGLNAAQILSYLVAGIGLARTPAEKAKFEAALANLTTADNQYDENMLNLKIKSPDDDNYSDDELTFLPYFTMALGLNLTKLPQMASALSLSVERTWLAVRAERSAPWNVMYTAINGSLTTQADIDNIAWNLRTWPLELIDFPVTNTIRRDIYINPEAERNDHQGNDDVRKILPVYERPQLRWNGDPHDLDGGSGRTEGDPGAWLMPYWLARYYGMIAS
ncbi:uncharacterized protein MONBRDRAFT_33081 [Monosiga brevicollis MX1]|uniref:Endo-1,3(4)-beta-glucanase n=1 Tax=Monosiga brevicollis TaxID=81824 RepID=A9V3E7_MONBE|nr:uncharacterized protein MONBRDRAFT_33081 [Monosiga brevicollis MX1]EDQ88047.1 predicted protein [Monosiga brevicollis MX1]|eukprot:XP_001747123.1 hypothetical protein [Monosiga brevicollis MX1]